MHERFTCHLKWMLGAFLISLFASAQSQAGELYVITRANFWTPHVGCLFRYDDGSMQWLHFRPTPFKKSLFGGRVPGKLDEEGFEDRINHIVGFRVPDEKLRFAEQTVRAEFAGDPQYKLFDRDCVTFAITICRACDLKTKDDHLAPITFFRYVKENNPFIECVWDVDRDKHGMYTLPWKRGM